MEKSLDYGWGSKSRHTKPLSNSLVGENLIVLARFQPIEGITLTILQ